MKHIMTLLSATALATALAFGAQAPASSTPASSTPASSTPAKSETTTAPVAKKHVKKHKKAAKTTPNVAPAAATTPAPKLWQVAPKGLRHGERREELRAGRTISGHERALFSAPQGSHKPQSFSAAPLLDQGFWPVRFYLPVPFR